MNGRARAWLAGRAGAVPPVLEARMERAIDDAMEDGSIAAMLSDAARICLRDALADPDSRAAALHLLAADALVTYACEAAVEQDGPELDRVVEEWSAPRLEEIVRRVESA